MDERSDINTILESMATLDTIYSSNYENKKQETNEAIFEPQEAPRLLSLP